LDRGIVGVGETLDVLDRAGLAHTGSARVPEERAGILYDVGDVTIGHASYSYWVAGSLRSDIEWMANGLDEELILADAADLRARGADVVVISLHWGIEHRYTPTSHQVSLGEALIASDDIDLIVGHHAHVLQPVVEIDGEYIFYGLGNFLSNQEPGCCGEESQEGAIMLVRVSPVDGDAGEREWAISDLAYVPTWVDRHRDYVIIPTIAWDVPEHRHAAWLQRSAERVGRDLQLDGIGLSIDDACSWMGTSCSSALAGSE
jgi:poly-gamma-glutamate synthesis protein (capsule biosynthesis protein)